MAKVRAFRGIRYNAQRFGTELSDLVCPPYDVIAPEEQAALYAHHPANFVRLELPQDEHPGRGPDRYQQAAVQYYQWLADGILQVEATPALYAYAQTFTWEGAAHVRRGFVAALGLEPWERRVVRPHERTLAGPKLDRLNLMRACRANFSPVWGLYRDPDGATDRLWQRVEAATTVDAYASDADGVEHQLWVVRDPETICAVEAAFADAPIYIADGHHRYETALRYQAESGARTTGSSQASDYVLAYLVEREDPGLLVLGTHRLLRCPRPLDRDALLASLRQWFHLEDVSGGPDRLLTAVEGAGAGAAVGVWAPRLGVSVLARRRDPDGVPASLAGERSVAWRRLDLAAVHILAIDQLFPEGTTTLSEAGYLSYTRSLAEAEAVVVRGAADVAFLVRKTPVAEILAVADAGDLMPEKSTYFYPKPVSGLVHASLEGEVGAMG